MTTSWPAGVLLTTLNFGDVLTAAAKGDLYVEVSVELVLYGTDQLEWVATHDSWDNNFTDAFPNPETITLPQVDQTGFVDAGGHPFTGWRYELTVKASRAEQSSERTFTVQPVAGQDVVNVYDLTDNSEGVPDLGPIPAVSSIAGLTGAIAAADLLAALNLSGGGSGGGGAGVDQVARDAAATAQTTANTASSIASAAQSTANSAGTTAGQAAITAAAAYVKPGAGIPKGDLANAVQTSLGAADSAVQPAALTAEANRAQTAEGLAAQKFANLSDLASAATARTNLGLGNVTNTSDANKPISTAQASGLATASGVAGQAVQYRTIPDLSQANAVIAPAPFAPMVGVSGNTIAVLTDRKLQPFYGVGAALTDAAAYCLMTYMTPAARTALLTEIFSPNQAGFSTVRIAFGLSDFSSSAYYTYDDMPTGQTDPNLVNFSIQNDTKWLIPLLQQIRTINPRVRVIAAIWTPPAWMKTTGSLTVPAGRNSGNPATATDLDMSKVGAFANYVAACVNAYNQYGIPIFAVSPQNEPFDNIGSQTFYLDADYATMIAAVGAALDNGLWDTKVLVGDHNPAQSSDAAAVVTSTVSAPFVGAVAWHDYGGAWFHARAVKRQAPNLEHHMTEMRTLSTQTALQQMQIVAGDLAISAVRAGVSSITMWNLVLDPSGNPFAGSPNPGYASNRRGIVTVSNDGNGTLTRNTEYYVLRAVATLVKPGAFVVESTAKGSGAGVLTMQSSAFVNPDGSIVLFVFNNATTAQFVQVVDPTTDTAFPVTLAAGEFSAFTWGTQKALAAATPGVAVPLTPAAAPVLTGNGGGSGAVKLTWTAPTSGTPLIAYRVWRGTAAGAETPLLMLTPGNLGFTDQTSNGLITGTPYFYKVEALSAAGEGAFSNEISGTPTAPAAPDGVTLSAAATTGQVTLTFTFGHTNGNPVTSWTITRSTTTGAEVTIATANQGSTSYVDATTVAGTMYFYKVKANNTTGAGTSPEVSVTAV